MRRYGKCSEVSRKHKSRFAVPKGTWTKLDNIEHVTMGKASTQSASELQN